MNKYFDDKQNLHSSVSFHKIPSDPYVASSSVPTSQRTQCLPHYKHQMITYIYVNTCLLRGSYKT